MRESESKRESKRESGRDSERVREPSIVTLRMPDGIVAIFIDGEEVSWIPPDRERDPHWLKHIAAKTWSTEDLIADLYALGVGVDGGRSGLISAIALVRLRREDAAIIGKAMADRRGESGESGESGLPPHISEFMRPALDRLRVRADRLQELEREVEDGEGAPWV